MRVGLTKNGFPLHNYHCKSNNHERTPDVCCALSLLGEFIILTRQVKVGVEPYDVNTYINIHYQYQYPAAPLLVSVSDKRDKTCPLTNSRNSYSYPVVIALGLPQMRVEQMMSKVKD